MSELPRDAIAEGKQLQVWNVAGEIRDGDNFGFWHGCAAFNEAKSEAVLEGIDLIAPAPPRADVLSKTASNLLSNRSFW